ncbi:MAG: 6-hydroxymethylpterin diphosphokinase MptE-like protein [Halovenus sp.]
MHFETWEPVYEAILADFGYDRSADRRARDTLAAILRSDQTFSPPDLSVSGRCVAVAGAGPTLESDVELARRADAVFAASTAADRLEACDVGVDCMVTDLDKNPGTVREFADSGIPVAVHAHGDNIPAIDREVPELHPASVIPTTQAAPVYPVRNFGGFTDGDRAAFLADAVGAGRLLFPGWSFDDSSVDDEKAHKLVWAERLLRWLERRRDERFAVLDGRRDTIEMDRLPV